MDVERYREDDSHAPYGKEEERYRHTLVPTSTSIIDRFSEDYPR